MATCPICKGPLTDDHRCSRRRGRLAAELIASALAGGVFAILLLAAFDPRGQITDMDTLTFTLGALAGVGINRFLRL
ncbi:MAG TPA: hypothetical protein VGL62_07905 [Vicinamibacterales bacterium]|jgi:hypothetical protein